MRCWPAPRACGLGLVNNAILSIGSVQAAKVQQAILRSYGPANAYAFHKRIYAAHGAIDGSLALETAKGLGFDAKSLETTADLPQVTDVIKRQRQLAEALGFQATPSFMLGSIGVLGYPGPACDEPSRGSLSTVRQARLPVSALV